MAKILVVKIVVKAIVTFIYLSILHNYNTLTLAGKILLKLVLKDQIQLVH